MPTQAGPFGPLIDIPLEYVPRQAGFFGTPEVNHVIDFPWEFFNWDATLHLNFREELEKYCLLAKRTLQKLDLYGQSVEYDHSAVNSNAPPLIALDAHLLLCLREELDAREANLATYLDCLSPEAATKWMPFIHDVMEAAMRIGALGERLKARPHEANAARGRKTLESAREGHKQTHGTAEEKRLRYRDYQAEVDRLNALNPRASKTEIANKVARKFKVSYKTVIRHTTLCGKHSK